MEDTEEEKRHEMRERDRERDEDQDVAPMTTKILSLVSYLLSQPGIKSAILQLIAAS